MAKETEPAKVLLPYLQRADELQKHEPLVAYYCRLYAMERGLKIPQTGRTKTTNSILISLMKQLEKDKKSLKLGPEDSLYLEGFASNVFAKADKQDRAGQADLNTAKTFYAASIFFEILYQFGELQSDLEQKQKYATWKAADIRKALKEGRKPEPGPPANDADDELSLLSSTTSSAYDVEPSKTSGATNSRLQSDPSQRFHDSTGTPPPSYSTSTYSSQDFHPPPPNSISENSSHNQQLYHHETHPQEVHHHFPQEHHHFPQESQQHFPQESQQHFPQESQQHFPQEPQQHLPQEPQQQHFPQEPQQFPQEPHHFPNAHEQHFSQNYPSHEPSSSLHSYHNFQPYPSFSESSLPVAPTHYLSYNQGSADSYSTQSASPTTHNPSSPQYNRTNSRNMTVSEPSPTPAPKFEYDVNYMPAPEKIVEAHKAARFAVGALAFDDVSVAVDFLKKSLELLTNPSAGQ